MKTRITEMFGIERPIMQGGMHYVGFAELAAAVSNAGGIGTITALTQPTPEALAKEIAKAKAMTDKPLAVNLTFLPSVNQPDYPGYIKSIIDGGIKVVGTRFIATKEAPVHENVKQAILNASELDTRLVMRPLRNTERVLTNAGVEKLLAKEKALGSAITFADIAEEVAGIYPRIMLNGEMELGAWSCGMVAGLIHDIPTCQDLMDRIMLESTQIIRGRLEAMLGD
jgi:NAD(P)H-dependent flavin oxidoreductase YrpB (nitropropane dioxygenase family)